MKRCVKCGGMITFRSKIELADSFICRKCFRELGFDKGYDIISHLYSYEKIKDGIDMMYWNERQEAKKKKERSLSDLSEEEKEILIQHLVKKSVTIAYGQEKDLDCEPEEAEMFNVLCSMYQELGRDPNELELKRFGSNYVTVKLGEWDLARMHWGPRAKWILFPTIERSDTKHRISAPEDVQQFSDLVRKSLESIEKYS